MHITRAALQRISRAIPTAHPTRALAHAPLPDKIIIRPPQHVLEPGLLIQGNNADARALTAGACGTAASMYIRHRVQGRLVVDDGL